MFALEKNGWEEEDRFMRGLWDEEAFLLGIQYGKKAVFFSFWHPWE